MAGLVNHIVFEQEEAITVVSHEVVFIEAITSLGGGGDDRRHEVELGVNRGRGGAGEELRERVLLKLDEDTGKREREQAGVEEEAGRQGRSGRRRAAR